MQNFATVLKEEIRRLARKEIRAQVSAMKRAVGQYRHDIARIKRQLAACQRQLARVSTGGKRAEKETRRPTRGCNRGIASRRAPYGPSEGGSDCPPPNSAD